MKLSFAKKLTLSYLFLVTTTLLLTGIYLTHRLRNDFLRQLEGSLSVQASLVADAATPLLTSPSLSPVLQPLVERLGKTADCRITFIRVDGVVQADSEKRLNELPGMDNHRTRPEVQAALVQGSGQSIRYSRTLSENMLYVALPLHSGRPPVLWGVVRVALPLMEVNHRIATFQKDLVKTGSAALLLAILMAWATARKISQPVEELTEAALLLGQGQFPAPLRVTSRDEFGALGQTFSDMSGRIQEKVQELSRERSQLSAILSALVESVLAVDHRGAVVFMNPAAEKLFAVGSNEAKQRPFLEVLRHSPLSAILQKVLQDRQPVSQEISVHAPQEHILSVHAYPVDYGEGQTGVLVALHDISELRRLEKVRQEFVANVSHELRTPLTSIHGFVETLLDGALEDPAHNREFLLTIREHTERLTHLIEDILDLSAIEGKRVEYRLESVALKELVDRLMKGLAPMAKGKGVSLINGIAENAPRVRADREKLAQVFMNLLDNGIKFNQPQGRVEVSAKTTGTLLEVAVKDTGLGIPDADLPRVFERFYRVDKARSRELGGTGLGLSIVKHLVEAHQGTVKVESKIGQGSLFTFTLPLA